MKNIESLIQQHTNEDGDINYEELENAFNQEINNIVAKKKPDTDKLKQELKGEVTKEILSGLGIKGESIDEAKAWAKTLGSTTDEVKEQALELEKKYNEVQTEYEKLLEEKTQIETKQREQEALAKIRQLGVKDDDQAEFLKFKVEKLVNEETPFDAALESFKEENPHFFREQGISTYRKIDAPSDTVSQDSDADVLAAFEAKTRK